VAAIEIKNLVKRYGANEVVKGIDLSIEEGEVFALLGPNGAGKSTTVEMLEGHRERTSGQISVLGFDPANGDTEFRDRIGIVLQETSVEKELTVKEAIEIHGGPYSKRRDADELIDIVGLHEKTNSRIGTLSGGQTRRLELALGIVGDPDVIFLDEPTTGFDPSARREAWKVIDNLRNLGKTILLTTHYMDEAQNLSDRVAVISAGEIVAEGTADTLGGRELSSTEISFRIAPGLNLPLHGEIDGWSVLIKTQNPTADLHKLTHWAVDNQVELTDLVVGRPSLEDVYLALTKN
jgi:ABC-2 type transport system ATP-binding protein